jgi:CBS domain-containing protein
MPKLQSLLTGRPVLSLRQDRSAFDAAREMAHNRVGALLITDAQERPCGIFTERDLMVRVVVPGRDPNRVLLSEVMTRELFTAPPERKVAEVLRELQERHIRHLPVVREERVIGMLSLRDLLRADLEQTTSDLTETRRYIAGEVVEPPDPLG